MLISLMMIIAITLSGCVTIHKSPSYRCKKDDQPWGISGVPRDKDSFICKPILDGEE